MSELPVGELRRFYSRNIYIAVYLLITYLLYQNAEFINLNLTTNHDRKTLECGCIEQCMKLSTDCM